MTLPSDSTFFGLNFEYQRVVYDQIFELIYHSNGGFDFESLFNMPVNLRSYYYLKLVALKKEEQESYKQQSQKGHGFR